jgi:hypothetical protein
MSALADAGTVDSYSYKRVTWGELISNAYPSQSGTYSVGFLGTLDVELITRVVCRHWPMLVRLILTPMGNGFY